ncbi:hypothetical protein ACEPAG_3432 [Sanghuangporus baumii]
MHNIPRTLKRYSSSNSASARANIKNLLFTNSEASQNGLAVEDASYATKTFDDGEASPMSGTPLSSRRSSLASGAALSSRRNSSTLNPAGARAFHTSTPAQSEEHGSYQFSPKELAAVKRRVEEEFALKSVTRSPLQSRRPSTKVPYESSTPDGLTRHPSGFVVPSPGPAPTTFATDLRPRAADKLPTKGVAESVITFADLKEMATTEQWTRSEKVPQEVRIGEGRVEHPSGFVPPTPQQPAMQAVKGAEAYKPAVDLHH